MGKEIWCIYTMRFISTITKKEIISFAGNLDGTGANHIK
jgi:hypothetical protein